MNYIRQAKYNDIDRIAEILVFNYRLNFYPIFRDDGFYFEELMVVKQKATYEHELDSIWVYDDGVVKGFEKTLEINGIGYRAVKQGNNLVLSVGYSHNIEMVPPAGITVEVPSQTQIIIKGADKQVVGEFAAKIRSKRPPEPYKGKGIKYSTEFVRRKEGKTGGKGKK